MVTRRTSPQPHTIGHWLSLKIIINLFIAAMHTQHHVRTATLPLTLARLWAAGGGGERLHVWWRSRDESLSGQVDLPRGCMHDIYALAYALCLPWKYVVMLPVSRGWRHQYMQLITRIISSRVIGPMHVPCSPLSN